MLVSTIKQFGLKLCADPEQIPFRFSENLQMQFVKDSNYEEWNVSGFYKTPGADKSKLLEINEEGIFELKADCFNKRGTLSFSFSLQKDEKQVHLGIIEFEVRESFGDGSEILPEDPQTWIAVVSNVAKDAIKEDVELIKEKAIESSNNAKSALESAGVAQSSANAALEAEKKALEFASSAERFKNSASNFAEQANASKTEAQQSATNASNSASNALTNANKAKEHLDSVNTAVSNFNTDYTEKINEFNTNYTTKKEAFDTTVNSAKNALNTTITEANTSIANKVAEATEQANRAESEADRATLATDGKLDKNQGADNAGKVMVVDEDGNVVPGSALPDNVYTQEEVDYLLRDKMDKPYADITITEDTTIDCTIDGNLKIDNIEGKSVQNVEENIVPTVARPISIVSKKVLANGEYVELRSLKETENLIDKKLCTSGYIVDNGGRVTPSTLANELTTDFIPLSSANQLSYRVDGTVIANIPASGDEKLWLGIGYYDAEKNFISRFTATSIGVGERVLAGVTSCPSNTYYFRFSFRTYEDVKATIVLGNKTIDSYIPQTVRDYKIVDHASKTAKIVRNVGVKLLDGENKYYSYSKGAYNIVTDMKETTGDMNAFCNSYEVKKIFGTDGVIFGQNNRVVYIMNENLVDKEPLQITEYFAQNPCVIQYELATPVEEEIEYVETDTTDFGHSWQDSTSPSPTIPSEIKGVDKIEVRTCGKNLINIENIQVGASYKTYIVCLTKPVVVSSKKNYSYKQSVWRISFTLKDGIKRYFNDHEDFVKINATFENPIIKIETRSVYITEGECSDIQIEYGDVATEYEPYKESAINYVPENPLLKSNAVADIIDTNNLKRINNIVKQNINELSFVYSNEQNGFVRFYAVANRLKYIGKTYSNILPSYDTYDYTRDSIYAGDATGGTTISIIVEKSKLTELTDAGLKNYINNPNAYVLYALSTPTEEPLPEDLINGLKELRTYSPVTNVFLKGEVNPTINAQYPKDLALAQEKLEATVLNLQEEVVKNV